MTIHVGCGSWRDAAYVGVLYPKGLPPNERLRAYGQWFDRIEVNSTYYAAPNRPTVVSWHAQTRPDFIFDLKLHRSCSENPAAAAKGEPLARLLDAAQPLLEAKKVGGFLLTLAPSFTPERHRLEELDALAAALRPLPLAVELRHRGWVAGDALAVTLDHFREHQLTWVALDLPRLDAPALLPPIDEVTTPQFAYLRLHGRNPDYLKAKDAAGRHHYAYSSTDLEEIAGRIRALAARTQRVHVSVNNHAEDFAPIAALALRRLLGQPVRTTLPPLEATNEAADGQLTLLD